MSDPAVVAATAGARVAQAWTVLDTVPDPEVPVVSVRDLGIVRDVVLVADGSAASAGVAARAGSGVDPDGDADVDAGSGAGDAVLEVVLTPTYSGCPATEVIERSVIDAVEAAGLGPVRVRLQRAPAWTTDWISADGRRKLREYGIAPPGPVAAGDGVPVRLVRGRGLRDEPSPACPRCGSAHTERLSAFGSTACKSLHRCIDCREPFEHFKPI